MRRRELARGFWLGAAVLAAGLLVLSLDWAGLVERFHEQRIESLAVDVLRRRAQPVDYDSCRKHPPGCLGKIVAWNVTVTSAAAGYVDAPMRQVRWLNGPQVPTGRYEAVAKIAAVRPDRVELLFLGTPSAPYGGTTWARKFGHESPSL